MSATEFWSWFAENESRLWRFDRSRKRLMDEIEEHLCAYNDGLSFEVSDAENGVRDLVISAGGDRHLFATVESFVSAAPALKRWKVVALKPPQGFHFVMDTADLRLDARELRFEPLTDARDPSALGIRVFVPLTEVGDHVTDAVIGLVESGLGERGASLIVHIEAAPMPTKADAFLALSDLAAYVDWFRNRQAKTKDMDVH